MNDFDQLIEDIESEAVAEGPAAVSELRAFDERFRLASTLMRARKEAGLTQRELAERSGVQQADISRIERAEVDPQASTLSRLLGPLGRRLDMPRDAEVVDAP